MPSATSVGSNAGFNADSRDPNHTVPEYPLTGPGSSAEATAAGNLANNPGALNEAARSKTGAGFSSILSTQASADEVARMTGGRAFYSRNDLRLALAEATSEGNSYYTISYSPTNQNYNGRLRQIDVSLARRGYTLSYRRCYYGTSPEAHRKPSASLMAAAGAEPEVRSVSDSLSAHMQHGAPTAHQIVFAAHLHPIGRPGMATPEQMASLSQGSDGERHKDARAPVKVQTFSIDYAVIARQFAAGGSASPTIEVAAAAYDADGRMLNGVVNRSVEGGVAAEAPAPKKLFKIQQSIDVPDGAVSIRVAMRDVQTDRMGCFEVALPLAPELRASAAH